MSLAKSRNGLAESASRARLPSVLELMVGWDGMGWGGRGCDPDARILRDCFLPMALPTQANRPGIVVTDARVGCEADMQSQSGWSHLALGLRKFRIGSAADVSEQSREAARQDLQDASTGQRESVRTVDTLSVRSNSEPGPNVAMLSRRRQESTFTDDTLVETVTSATSRLPSRSKDIEDPLGLWLVHGQSDSHADLIFVHGLGGSSRRTWSWDRNPEIFWPAWIRHEQGLSHFRVFSFGYNANFKDSDTPLTILDFSKSLLIRMRTYGQSSDNSSIGTKPIVFIAHSMGGLVVKKALIIGKNDDYYSLMLTQVHGIMFLSTPHRGSTYASSLNTLLSLMVGTSSKNYVSELDSSSTSIEDVGEQFRAICTSWQLVSLYESLPTKFSPGVRRMIVGKDSGVLNYPREISSPVDADHHTVCKYQSRLDPNYLLVTDLLRQLTSGLELETRPRESVSDSSEDQEILERIFGLTPKTMREDVDKNLFRALPGSCQWLHRRESFRNWLDTSDHDHGVLCFTGLPGTGKSTLAAMTIDYIQKALRQKSCQYHFFVESQPMKKMSSHCLKTIAFQLACSYPVLADKLAHLHHETGFKADSQKFQVLWDILFENLILKTDFGCTLHWVIDAVDEADTPRLLVTRFVQMKPRSSIKVLFLTRPKKDITNQITSRLGLSAIDTVSIDSTSDDIRHYIHSLAKEILPSERSTQEYVIDQITAKAQGSFLWTRLALESLRESWHTSEDIEDALNKVPKDMQSLYQKMLHNVQSQPPRLQQIAFRVLTWASYGFRPLSILELDEALKPEYDGFLSLSETVVQICGHFVRVDNDTVSLIHSTARQFLLESNNIQEYTGVETGHDHLAIRCLQYLCHDHWRQTLSTLYEDDISSGDRLQAVYDSHPLLRYSMHHWAYHVSESRLGAPTILMFLRLFCGKFMLQWIHAVALSHNLQVITKAARHIRLWIKKGRKYEKLYQQSLQSGGTESSFLEDWVTDLIRIVGKFGANLLHKPSTIYRHIPPLCPASSIIYRTFIQTENQLVTVQGLSNECWDDRLSKLPLTYEELPSKIRCAGTYYVTLISHSGAVIVWQMETCAEIRRLEHNEWVTLMEINQPGTLVATGGRFTFRIWDLSTGQQLYFFNKTNPARALSLDFANTDTELFVAYDDCSVVSICLSTGQEEVVFTEDDPDPNRSCARFMTLSPDQTKLAMGFRGRPVVVWNLSATPRLSPRVCIRAADKDLLEGGDEVFNSPEIVRWHPDNASVLILYQDTTIVLWNFTEDEHLEFENTEAREMVLNADGSQLLTSSNSGSISIWDLPKFNLVYRLSSDEFVRDLTFSPDGQRIYDVRGSGCNVWAPEALVRSVDMDREESSSSHDGSSLSEATTEPTYASDKSSQSKVTALAVDNENEYFCCGKDDGSVAIHDITDGKRLRKVCNYSATADIMKIEWSASRRFLVSADDSGKIVLKRLRIKDDGKWAVFPVLDIRVEEAIDQLIFNPDESALLISTDSTDFVWDIKSKKQTFKKIWASPPDRKWLNHPWQPEYLLRVCPNYVMVHEWSNLAQSFEDATESVVRASRTVPNESELSSIQKDPASLEEKVSKIVHPSSHQYLVVETMPRTHSAKHRSLHGARWDLVFVKSLSPGNLSPTKRRTLSKLGPDIQHLLGCYHDRLVFIDHMNWLCTCTIGWDMGPVRRHYFLPRDWINASTLHLLAFNKAGTLLCARDGEVAIVRYVKGL
ncbi:hypothetical protein F5Y18DRAFT_432995 [Xylariaceae sp. FL1019]|nr:hypothetical protein F5Y18DRAFT_432995 [Xylariaceae sp. FL1019]